MKLEKYTDKELRAELSRRHQLRMAKRAAIPRCRQCTYWGSVTRDGVPVPDFYKARIRKIAYNTAYCPFFKAKRSSFYLGHCRTQKACRHFKREVEE